MRDGGFTSRLHTERLAALLGIALGVAFTICFLTGLLSHAAQNPPSWFTWPSRPAGLYRVTQGLHVATGIASIPLLLAKLWVAYPRLWIWPPVTGVAHALERISLVPLVAGSLFLLFTGVQNTFNWYPWGFFFPAAHFWASWIAIGGLVVHIGAKATTAVDALRHAPPEPAGDGLSRRELLTTVAAASGLLTLVTVGQTVRPLRRLAALAPRRPDIGPQGFPVNKSAASAGVTESARSPGYRLVVTGRVRRELELSIDDLRAMPMREATLPIACVEGWSASASWRGVPVRDLLLASGAEDGRDVLVSSLQPRGLYRRSTLNPVHAADRDTLLAVEVNGEPLHLDHGFPVRLIGPNRPGVMQTKWVSGLEVL